MAEGPWTKAYASLWRGPKAAKLAEFNLGQRRHAAGGMFLELMAWAMDACESGDLGTVRPEVLAQAVGLRAGGGRTLADRGRELLAALKVAGFVVDDERAHVKGWDDAGPGPLIERRHYERDRKAVRRARERNGELSRTSGDGQAEVRGPSGASQARPLSQGTPTPLFPPVPRDNGQNQARNNARVGSGHGDVPRDMAKVSQVRAEQSRADIAPVPPGQLGEGTTLEIPADVRAAFVVSSAGEPWRTALEAFRGAFGNGALLTWMQGASFARGPEGGAIVTVLNAFQAEYLTAPGKRYVDVLRTALAPHGVSRVEIESPRRPMGEPGVVR